MSPAVPGIRRRAVVSLGAIAANAAAVARGVPLESCCADVRADAYGHGLTQVAVALAVAGVGWFRVSTREDAAQLREAGVAAEILVGDAPVEGAVTELGLGVYGLAETGAATAAAAAPRLTPTLTVFGEVITVKTVPAGQGVSYGYTYHTAARTRLALVALGYADGIPRLASNVAPALLNGRTVTISGRIAMDQFVLDIGDGDAAVGDTVVLFGDPAAGEPSVADWAQATGLPAQVILTGLGPRIEREYA